MDEAEYGRILNAGHGRAVTLLAEHDALTFQHVLLHACTHYTAFDPAIEGDRSAYLFEVITATAMLPFYRDGLFVALRAAGAAPRYDAAQRFALAGHLAAAGDAEARTAMYDAFSAHTAALYSRRTGDVVGAAEIVALDGWAGFLFVAERLGALCDDSDRVWFTDGPLTVFETRYAPHAIAHALAPVTQDNPHIAAYMEQARQHRRGVASLRGQTDDTAVVAPLTYDAVTQIVAASDRDAYRRRLGRWGETAADDDLARVAADFLYEDDVSRLVAYAQVFARRPFPDDPAKLIALARAERTDAAQAALNALARIAHPAVRAFALTLFDDPRRSSMAADLLAHNYAPGDEERLQTLLASDAPLRLWHWFGYGALKVFAAHPTEAAIPALRRIYDQTPCSRCRFRAVTLLHDLGEWSDAMAVECLYDAHPGTRALAADLPQHTVAESASIAV